MDYVAKQQKKKKRPFLCQESTVMMLSHAATLIKHWWRLLVIVLTPLVLLPLPLLVGTIQARCAYIVLLLTIYWVSEAMPYAVTSLFPLAFFPMAGVIPGDLVGLNYFKDITTLFVGSMTLAHAMEHVLLHRRLALLVLSVVGSSTKWSMAGLMGVTAFLSMWINNSAATSIMIPAAIAIIDELQSHQQGKQETVTIGKDDDHRRPSKEIVPQESTIVFDIKTCVEEQATEHSIALESVATIPNGLEIDHAPSENQLKRTSKTVPPVDYQQLKTGFLIAVAYSAAIGGMGTLVGTGPNIFVKGFVDDSYATGRYAFQISFANFLLFAFPISIVMIVLCWLWLQLLYNRREFFRWRNDDPNVIESQKHLQSVLKQQYKELGPLNWKEGTIAILFVVLVVLWVTRDFSSYPGWGILFRKDYVTDGTAALLIGSLPLILPDRNPFSAKWEYKPVLRWDHLSKTFPWGVFMLQGAGLAIADGFRESDLSSTIASFLQFVVGAPEIAVIFVVIVISAIFTEFTSNLACASILFPILNSVAHSANIHAARLILPSCMAVSLSFMLPIATPPNAMIFSSGHVRIADLIKCGFVLKLIGIVIILLASMVILSPVFRIGKLTPILNSTLIMNGTSG